MYSKIIKATKSRDCKPVITYEVQVPTWVWWDLLTHRALSRNASSTRAIPPKKIREDVINNPCKPVIFTKYQKGMVANEPLSMINQRALTFEFYEIQQYLLEKHAYLESVYDLSKQDLNILLAPFYQFRAVITATEWENFFYLRVSKEAKPNVQYIALQMFAQYLKVQLLAKNVVYTKIFGKIYDKIKEIDVIIPENLEETLQNWLKDVKLMYVDNGSLHLPYVRPEEEELEAKKEISVARCARVSYKTFTTDAYSDVEADIKLAKKLAEQGHLSPFEHVAIASPKSVSNNFRDWVQYRDHIDLPPKPFEMEIKIESEDIERNQPTKKLEKNNNFLKGNASLEVMEKKKRIGKNIKVVPYREWASINPR